MRPKCFTLLTLVGLLLCANLIVSPAWSGQPTNGANQCRYTHFVPNSQAFWDFSKNWTTNYGPAYRDTVLDKTNFVPCIGEYALCFESGAEPLPCKLTSDGRFANCKCVVHTGRNFVLMTAILNKKVYQDTVKVCGPEGADCVAKPNKAPVCKAINDGTFIPGAGVISTYSPDVQSDLVDINTDAVDQPPLTVCPKEPYAGCMTAPCKVTNSGDAECSCPIFWGIFQLIQDGAECTLNDDLVWSASYDPARDVLP